MDNNNNLNYDPEAFKEFFGTHQTDVNVPDDITTPETVEEETDVDVDDSTVNTDATTTDDNTDSTDDAQQDTTKQQRAKNNANAVFAQMRTQNKKQQQVLNQIAQQLGVQDTSNPDAVLNALQTLATKAQAQKQGIPEEFLQRFRNLEEQAAEHEKQNLLIAAGRGFQALKTQHHLTDEDLNNFADELIADGLNPYEQPVDLLREYRNRHFDDLINAAVQRGIQQEAERSAKASRQSTTPSHSNGDTEPTTEGKINTVEGLNKWLEEHTK